MNNTDIIINGEKIDYSLENEKTVGDVMRSIAEWLNKSRMCVDSLLIDEQHPSNDQWKNRPIDDVSSLKVNAMSLREYSLNKLELAKNYLLQLSESYKNHDKRALDDLARSYGEFLLVLSDILKEDISTISTEGIGSLFSENESEVTRPEQVLGSMDNIIELLEKYYEEAAHPQERAVIIVDKLASLAESFDEVAVQLQTGRDATAMNTIIDLTDLLQALLRCMAWTDDEDFANKLCMELPELLAELEEALVAHDTVLIGDLLEYEMKPRLIDLQRKLV